MLLTRAAFYNRRLLIMLLLGFASGLPLALTGSTLQAWLTNDQINLKTIGLLSFLGLPYLLKFLWAPCMDHFKILTKDRRKGWILVSQIGLLISIYCLSLSDPAHDIKKLIWIALIVAFFGASQDIAIDAYRTNLLQEKERGLGAAYFVFSYRLSLLISGGLSLIMAHYWGWRLTYQIMSGIMLLSMIPTYFAPNIADASFASYAKCYQTFLSSLYDFWERDKLFLLILFVLFYKFGDALALSLMTNFLLHGLQFSLIEVGLAYKTVSFIAVILGGFVGGLLLLRMNLYQGLLIFGLAQSFSNLMFVLLASLGKHFFLMSFAIFIENFCSGLSTAAFFAFLMSVCNIKYSAGQYALLSAVATFPRVFLGPVAAIMVAHLGWTQFYFYSFVLCFPGILFLVLLKDKVHYDAHAIVH